MNMDHERGEQAVPPVRSGGADDLLLAATNAAATIAAIYQWVEQIEAIGGATSMAGIAKCHAMLTSLRRNADRTETLVLAPLRAAIAKATMTAPRRTGSAPS
jgi:hypothetical protein